MVLSWSTSLRFSHKKSLAEALLMSTQNICFWEIRKILILLSWKKHNIYSYVFIWVPSLFRADMKWVSAWENQQNGMCTQPRLRSAWASAQSDQILRWPHAWVLSYPLSAQRRLIRLGGCPGWSESSLSTHAILLVLSWGGSNVNL